MFALHHQPPPDIVLVVDGSVHAGAAVKLLCHLPLPLGSHVTAVGILTPRQTPSHAALAVALTEARTILQNNGVMVTTELLQGHPAKALTEFAEVQEPGLIVVGATGLRATLGILLGGVVQQVVEYAHWPVLVMRAPYRGLRRVLLVTDGAWYSQDAVNYLAQFPLPVSTKIGVMHVLSSRSASESLSCVYPISPKVFPSPVIFSEAAEAMAQEIEHKEHEGQAILEQAVERLKSAGKEAAPILVRGDAAREIIQYIANHSIDLVVTGSRGLGQLNGWLLGSVSRNLVHHAGCSVLVVKGQAAKEQGWRRESSLMRQHRYLGLVTLRRLIQRTHSKLLP